MKIIIIGTSLSGKTTLVRLLRKETGLPISEIDEELMRQNNSEYPSDAKFKQNVIAPKVVKDILGRNEVVFFTNTDYFTLKDLSEAKNKGFKIIQLDISLADLLVRNKRRIKEEGYDDMSKWLPGMVEYQNEIKKADLLNATIDANEAVEKIAEKLLKIIQ